MEMNVGKELKLAREAKGLTIEQVSQELYIRATYLQAIENGRTEILPSIVQGRGFVRMYAEYLGINAQRLLDGWEKPDGPRLSEMEEVHETIISPIEPTRPRKKPEPEANAVQIKKKVGWFQKDAPSKQGSELETQEISSSALFKEIGDALRQRRENLHLSYEDCEQQTLVRSFYLEAMENGQFDRMSSYIQARGMLNNYANFLNLDAEKILLKYADALQLLSKENKAQEQSEENAPKQRKKRKPVKKAGKLRQFFTPDLFVGVTVILGMAAIIIYSAVTIADYKAKNVVPTIDLNQVFIQRLVEATAIVAFHPSATAVPEHETMQEAQIPTQPPDEAEQAPVQILVEAKQRAFLNVIADGKEVFVGRVLQGDVYPFRAEQKIELKTGNGAAFSVTYNQVKMGALGSAGEVVQNEYYVDGVTTPTPMYSPTPTVTFQPTYTPEPITQPPTATITPYIP